MHAGFFLRLLIFIIVLEIAVNENFVKPTVDAITRAGQLSAEEASGFGKIFLT